MLAITIAATTYLLLITKISSFKRIKVMLYILKRLNYFT